jgi:hypothetical protein
MGEGVSPGKVSSGEESVDDDRQERGREMCRVSTTKHGLRVDL